MKKLLLRGVLLLFFAAAGVFCFSYFRAGYHKLPEWAELLNSVSFKSGFRAAFSGFSADKANRRYFGYPFEVPHYLEDVWAKCTRPSKNDEGDVAAFMNQLGNRPGERFEAFCIIELENEKVLRGIVTSVPRM